MFCFIFCVFHIPFQRYFRYPQNCKELHMLHGYYYFQNPPFLSLYNNLILLPDTLFLYQNGIRFSSSSSAKSALVHLLGLSRSFSALFLLLSKLPKLSYSPTYSNHLSLKLCNLVTSKFQNSTRIHFANSPYPEMLLYHHNRMFPKTHSLVFLNIQPPLVAESPEHQLETVHNSFYEVLQM